MNLGVGKVVGSRGVVKQAGGGVVGIHRGLIGLPRFASASLAQIQKAQ